MTTNGQAKNYEPVVSSERKGVNVLTVITMLVWARSVAQLPAASTQPASAESSATPTSQPARTPPRPLPGPRYAPLRYNDDFRYLDGPPGTYTPDFFDPIKRIKIGDDIRVRLGGDTRGRLEAVTHKRYGDEIQTEDTLFLHRYYYHANIEYRQLARFFIEGVNAWQEDVDGTPVPNGQDRFDLHQMFLDLRVLGEQVPLTLRVGRQELLYGKQRLVGPLGWTNVQRTWDGVKLLWEDKTWNVDGWYARPVVIENKGVDDYDEDIHFYGVYATYKGIPNHGIDLYYLGARNSGRYTNANWRTGDIDDLTVHTVGSRFFGKMPIGLHAWDYDTELAGQWGQASGDTIQAWMWSADTGYTVSNYPWKPRIGIGFDYASGDDNPFDDIHGTFNQLFPTGHIFFGYLDQVGRQNIWAQNVNVTVKPHDKVTAQTAWHTFWTDKNRDALYNAAGMPVRRSVRGRVGDEIGNELDFTLQWLVDPHLSLLFGYSHMWTSHFISGTGRSEDPDLLYLMYLYQF